MTGLLASALLCTFLVWAACALACALAYPVLRPPIWKLHPVQASNYLLALLALPALCSAGTALLLYLPDASRALVSTHCHAGNCSGHGPRWEHASIPAGVIVLWYSLRLARYGYRDGWTGRRLARQLRAAGEVRGRTVELGAAEPAAFTLGWWRPTIFLSRGLLDQCTPGDVACIVAHEEAHNRRRDNLRLFAARALVAVLPGRLGRVQIEDLQLLHELAADREAAGDCGPEAVAASLLKVARLQAAPPPPGSAAFAGNATVLRVQSLLVKPPARLPAIWSFLLVLLALSGVVALINPLHRLIESLPPLGH